MAKRILCILFSFSLILALSFSSSALITRQNGVCYSNLPEPQPSNSSCAIVLAINWPNGEYVFYMLVFTLYKNVNTSVVTDHDNGSNTSYQLVENGNINVLCTYNTDSNELKFELFDGLTSIKIVNLITDIGAGTGVYGLLQIYDLSNNHLQSYRNINDIMSAPYSFTWDIDSYQAYGNIKVRSVGSHTDTKFNLLSIAWNEAYTSNLELDKLSQISTLLGSVDSTSKSIDSRLADLNRKLGNASVGDNYSFYDLLTAGFLNQGIYFEGLKQLLSESNNHQSNIDSALNGQGQSYNSFDKSTINEYDSLEKSLNSDFSGDFSNIVNNLDISSFSSSFTFWRDSFNSLIVNPVDNIGLILTSFISFALILGLVIFILGKRG